MVAGVHNTHTVQGDRFFRARQVVLTVRSSAQCIEASATITIEIPVFPRPSVSGFGRRSCVHSSGYVFTAD